MNCRIVDDLLKFYRCTILVFHKFKSIKNKLYLMLTKCQKIDSFCTVFILTFGENLRKPLCKRSKQLYAKLWTSVFYWKKTVSAEKLTPKIFLIFCITLTKLITLPFYPIISKTNLFRSVEYIKPESSRKESSELYLLARDFKGIKKRK